MCTCVELYIYYKESIALFDSSASTQKRVVYTLVQVHKKSSIPDNILWYIAHGSKILVFYHKQYYYNTIIFWCVVDLGIIVDTCTSSAAVL